MKTRIVFTSTAVWALIITNLMNVALAGSLHGHALLRSGTPMPTASATLEQAIPIAPANAGRTRELAQLQSGTVNAVAFSPDGKTLAVAGSMGVWLYQVSAPDAMPRLLDVVDGCSSVAFSPDGAPLACGSNSSTAQLWNVVAGTAPITLRTTLPENYHSAVLGVTFSADGKTLAAAIGGHAWLWDIPTGTARSIDASSSPIIVFSVAFSPDGKVLATGSCSRSGYMDLSQCTRGEIRLWDAATGTEQGRLMGHDESVTSLAFSPDGKLLASGSIDYAVWLWDVETRSMQTKLEGHTGPVWSLTFSPDGKLLASGGCEGSTNRHFVMEPCNRGEIRLWDVNTGQSKVGLTGHRARITALAFSPNGTLLASGSRDGMVRLWGVR